MKPLFLLLFLLSAVIVYTINAQVTQPPSGDETVPAITEPGIEGGVSTKKSFKEKYAKFRKKVKAKAKRMS